VTIATQKADGKPRRQHGDPSKKRKILEGCPFISIVPPAFICLALDNVGRAFTDSCPGKKKNPMRKEL